MKKAVLFLLPLILIVGCDLFKNEIVEVVIRPSVELSVSQVKYKADDIVMATTTLSSDSTSAKYYWKLDDDEYVEGASTKTFGPFGDDISHKIYCKVEYDGVEYIKSETVSLAAINRFGKLDIIGSNLCDETGSPVQLRGMSTHGIQYYPDFYVENSIQALAEDWGADIIRVSCYVNEGWGAHGDYLSDPSYWRGEIDNLVDLAEKYGLYVLIDWHMLGPGDPNYFINEAKEFWAYMAKEHGQKEFVLFDICNEPNDHGTWDGRISGKDVSWDIIKNYADEIIPIIRAQSPDNIVIVGTPEWASRPDHVIGNELDYNNIMYTMHFYAASHGNNYRSYVERAMNAGVPVFVTEFGTQNSAGEESNDFEESTKWLDLLDRYDISWCNWNYSSDHRSGAVFKNYVNEEDRLLEKKSNDIGWGALTDDEKIQLRNAEVISYNSVDDYSNPDNLKASGLWIFDKIKNR